MGAKLISAVKEETKRWQMYEAGKKAWKLANPNATPQQYEQAMRALADKLEI